MHFDFCIGNPPYQETKGGTKNIDIWPYFINGAKDIADNICYVHPGRWLIPKKQMEEIHKKILASGLKCFDYYSDGKPLLKGKLFSDEFFYKNFGFSKELINHIEKSISVKKDVSE